MKKFVTILVLIAISIGGYYYKDEIKDKIEKLKDGENEETTQVEQKKILRNFPAKEIEIFDLKEDEALLTFSKNAETSSSEKAYLIPQTSGKVTNINVEVGDKVSKDDVLITLGDSPAIDAAELQYELAQQSLEIAKETAALTKQSSNETISSTELGIAAAKESYENSIKVKENTEKILNNQIESAEIGIEMAEDSYKNTKDNYEDLLDTIDDMEDQLDDLEDQYDELEEVLPENDETLIELKNGIAELESAIEQTKSQKESLKFAKETAKNSLEQAKIGLEQLKNNANSQISQLDSAVKSLQIQYESTQTQSQSAYTGTQLQELGLESQVEQAKTALESAKINLEQKYIKSPIDGIVTSISTEEENFVSAGQAVIKVENSDKLSIKTSLNENEIELVSIGDEVKIEKGSTTTKGKIISISPTTNEITKKIDIEIEVKDEKDIKAGSFVKITFTKNPKDIIFIPLNSIHLRDDNQKYVKIVEENNTVSTQDIETGQIIGKFIEIKDGLKGNEKIVESSTAFIAEGEKIKIVN